MDKFKFSEPSHVLLGRSSGNIFRELTVLPVIVVAATAGSCFQFLQNYGQ